MARKIILKDDGLNGAGSAPTGYSFFGKNGSTLSEKVGATVSGVGGGSDYTEAIVNISSAQILSLGSSPVELLPAAGINNYYEIEKVILEYTHVSTAYNFGFPLFVYSNQGEYAAFTGLIQNAQNKFVKLTAFNTTYGSTYNAITNSNSLNEKVTLNTWNNNNPSLGDGTIRVKIYYKVITFGV